MTDNTIPQTDPNSVTANIELLGKPYQIKCREYEIPALQKAAEYLNNLMKTMPAPTKLVSPEKLGIMAALNLASQILEMEQRTNQQFHFLNQRLSNLQHKLENALPQSPSQPSEPPALESITPFRLEIESVQA